MAVALESAIPEYLQQDRVVPANLPANHEPPFPSYSARLPEQIKDLVMAIIGVQHEQQIDNQSKELQEILTYVQKPTLSCMPYHHELASVTDNRGYLNEVAIVYWMSQQEYEDWKIASGFDAWWQGLRPQEEYGWFLEVLFPSIDRLETIFSDNHSVEGAAYLKESISDAICEHGYWGSMRDRLPISQVDTLDGVKARADQNSDTNTKKRRMHVPGRENLAIIRSGQDWSNTNPHERKLYLETMHPVLIKGMDFLRDQGEEVGCFSNRFMSVVSKTSSGESTDKTFGLSYFDDLASLEGWSKKHKTHLDIFGRFLEYAGELKGNITLSLFHEVMVLEPEQQYFEYVGCHNTTGMLASQ